MSKITCTRNGVKYSATIKEIREYFDKLAVDNKHGFNNSLVSEVTPEKFRQELLEDSYNSRRYDD